MSDDTARYPPLDVPAWSLNGCWRVDGWSGAGLQLIADIDLTYHHELEVRFESTHFLMAPEYFDDPVFRAPTPVELGLVKRYVGKLPPVVVAFDLEAHTAPGLVPCLIAADEVTLVEETVLHYYREDLMPGMRLADWVRRPDGSS